MFLLDDILKAPAQGLLWVVQELHEAARRDRENEAGQIRNSLRELYLKVERGEISDDEFDEQERVLLDRLDLIETEAGSTEEEEESAEDAEPDDDETDDEADDAEIETEPVADAPGIGGGHREVSHAAGRNWLTQSPASAESAIRVRGHGPDHLPPELPQEQAAADEVPGHE